MPASLAARLARLARHEVGVWNSSPQESTAHLRSPAHCIGWAEPPLHFFGTLRFDVSVAVKVFLPGARDLPAGVHRSLGRDDAHTAMMEVPPGFVQAARLIGADDDVG